MLDDNLRPLRPKDAPAYHRQQAAHFRELAESATTATIRTRLLDQAEEHERLAKG